MKKNILVIILLGICILFYCYKMGDKNHRDHLKRVQVSAPVQYTEISEPKPKPVPEPPPTVIEEKVEAPVETYAPKIFNSVRGQSFAKFTINNVDYYDVLITDHNPVFIAFRHREGMARIFLRNLSYDERERFGFDLDQDIKFLFEEQKAKKNHAISSILEKKPEVNMDKEKENKIVREVYVNSERRKLQSMREALRVEMQKYIKNADPNSANRKKYQFEFSKPEQAPWIYSTNDFNINNVRSLGNTVKAQVQKMERENI